MPREFHVQSYMLVIVALLLIAFFSSLKWVFESKDSDLYECKFSTSIVMCKNDKDELFYSSRWSRFP